MPPSGPASNVIAISIVPAGWSWGTRTEAEQNVPQANPDLAFATPSLLSAGHSVIVAGL